MKITFLVLLLALFSSCLVQAQKTDIMLLGSDHLAQIYKRDKPNTDVLLPNRQREIDALSKLIVPYKPDIIMVEVLPERQREIDSLYTLYINDNLKLEAVDGGRNEVYQLAFRMAKQLGLPKIHCVNAPGGTSQSMLDNGENINQYKEEGVALRSIVIEKLKALEENSLSLKDYYSFLNQSDTYNKVYHLRYITPARVINGTFKNPDERVDTAFIDSKYIGAELTSIFKNRDYKIYSNIVNAQMKTNAKKLLLIIGVAHIGSLRSIFRDDSEYNIVETSKYLSKLKKSK